MAKQSGIHQLRGKVGEMSYYRQAGVEPGLVRRINQGMSDRVKTADEFANTRLNNAEFAHANALAKSAFDCVKPSWRTMFRRFAIAKMTARFLQDVKRGSGNWGTRLEEGNLGALYMDALENYAKGGEYQGQYGSVEAYSTEITVSGGDFTSPAIELTIDTATQATLLAEGIDGVDFVQDYYLLADKRADAHEIGRNYTQIIKGRSTPSVVEANFTESSSAIIQEWNDADYSGGNFHLASDVYDSLLDIDNTGCLNVVAMLPWRKINNQKHILQEKCTFICYGCGWKDLQG